MSDLPGWVVPTATFIAGLALRPLIPSWKELKDVRRSRKDLSLRLKKERDDTFHNFRVAYDAFNAIKDTAEAGAVRRAVWDLRQAADRYFGINDTIAAMVLCAEIDSESLWNEHLEELTTVAVKGIPQYYEAMRQVAAKHGITWTDTLTPSSYRNIRLVIKGRCARPDYEALLKAWKLEDPLDKP